MFTGRAPIAQPPGSDTSARPNRATSGPSTRIAAPMVFTSSYGAKPSRTVDPSTSMRMRSSTVTVAPILPSSSTVVVTSFRCGTFATTTGSSASSAAARIGSGAFLAPEMRTSPSRGTPPWICSLSMLAVRRLFGRQCLDRQGVNLATHELAQRAVDQLVAGHALQLRKLARDDARGKMGVVIRLHAHLCSGEARADQPCDFFRVHGRKPPFLAASSLCKETHCGQTLEIRVLRPQGRAAALCDREHDAVRHRDAVIDREPRRRECRGPIKIDHLGLLHDGHGPQRLVVAALLRDPPKYLEKRQCGHDERTGRLDRLQIGR